MLALIFGVLFGSVTIIAFIIYFQNFVCKIYAAALSPSHDARMWLDDSKKIFYYSFLCEQTLKIICFSTIEYDFQPTTNNFHWVSLFWFILLNMSWKSGLMSWIKTTTNQFQFFFLKTLLTRVWEYVWGRDRDVKNRIYWNIFENFKKKQWPFVSFPLRSTRCVGSYHHFEWRVFYDEWKRQIDIVKWNWQAFAWNATNFIWLITWIILNAHSTPYSNTIQNTHTHATLTLTLVSSSTRLNAERTERWNGDHPLFKKNGRMQARLLWTQSASASEKEKQQNVPTKPQSTCCVQNTYRSNSQLTLFHGLKW